MGAHRGAFLQIWEGLVEIRVQFGEGNVQSFGRHFNSGLSSQIKLGATNGKANNMGRYWTMMLASIVFEEEKPFYRKLFITSDRSSTLHSIYRKAICSSDFHSAEDDT